jgi:tryptophanyl-tRNA synthetase
VTRVLSCLQPTGDMTLGNYLGAIRHWVDDQTAESYHGVVDLHALTIPRDPAELRAKSLDAALVLLAAGLDPDVTTIFMQSHVPEHARLSWLMTCTVSFGELSRMTQFKDKTDTIGDGFISAGLFTYPALMAADILLYDAEEVPVGDDQRQHLEITRDIAQRFNSRYGDTFVVPKAAIPKFGARIMDLQEPTNKMSKSADSPQGTVMLLDAPKDLERKIKRAVTDTDGEVKFDPINKPGVSNLLTLLALSTNVDDPATLVDKYTQYGPLKTDTASALIEFLRPTRERYEELKSNPDYVREVLAKGAAKARSIASVTLARAEQNIGLLPA